MALNLCDLMIGRESGAIGSRHSTTCACVPVTRIRQDPVRSCYDAWAIFHAPLTLLCDGIFVAASAFKADLAHTSSTVSSAADMQTASDDLTFYSYQVWETAMDFFKHIKSDAVKPLGKLIIDEVRGSELRQSHVQSFVPSDACSTWVLG